MITGSYKGENNMNKLLTLYNKFEKVPFGRKIFSILVCIKAPYFGSIKPVFVELQSGRCVMTMKKRRSVQNHIKSVHAIAMCNISELTAGTAIEAAIPSNMRWIPKKMSVEYLKVAKTDLKAVCDLQGIDWEKNQDVPMTVDVTDTNGVVVFRAIITMYVSHKK